jgi:hypothetical protein
MDDVAPPPEPRRTKRGRVFRSGKIIFGYSDSTIDCLILDESPHGVRVETSVPMTVPEEVKLTIVGGGTYPAIRRWVRGNSIGFEFVGNRINDDLTLAKMHAIKDVLETRGVPMAVHSLRSERFFNNIDLQRAAEEAEAAVARLNALLCGK